MRICDHDSDYNGAEFFGRKIVNQFFNGKNCVKDSKYLRNVVLNGVFLKQLHQTKTFNENSQLQILLVKHTYFNKNMAIPTKES